MNQVTHEKEVDFSFCNTCVNKDKTEAEEPCNSCLSQPVNFESTKPVKYEKNPKVKDKIDIFKEQHKKN